MKTFLTKTISDSILDIDDKSRRVKVVIARMGNEDRDKEIIDEGAFTKTIKERGPKGTNEIWHLIDHNPTLTRALGKFSELYTEGDKLIGVNESIVKNTVGDDIMELYKAGHINQHSIGFSIPKGKTESKNGITHINEVQLWEGSAVLWGANPLTETISVGKSVFHIIQEESYGNIASELEKVKLSLLKSKLSDDACQLMKIYEIILETKLHNFTKPESTTLPNANEEKDLQQQLLFYQLKFRTNGDFRFGQRP